MTDPSTVPLAAMNLEFVESCSGYALCMTGSDHSIFALAPLGADGRLNLSMNGPQTIRFWFAPDWTSASAGGAGPGASVRLLEIGAWSGQEAVGWWSLGIDPSGTALAFVSHEGGKAGVILEAPIQWTAGHWHQVALAWAPNGPAVLYLDGQVAAQGTGMAPKPLTTFTGTRGFCVGSDVQGGRLAQGQFEELHTFDRVLTAVDMSLDYDRNASRAVLGPVTPEEENAMLAAAAMALAQAGPAGGGGSQFAMGSGNYDCDLWLEIGPPSSGEVTVILHNTAHGVTYQLWSKSDLNSPAWTLQQTLVGLDEQTPAAPITVSASPTMFFKAVRTGVLTGYQICMKFEGIGYAEAGSAVPDSMGAVGPNHFVEIVNWRIVVFNRDGSRTGEEAFLSDFFQPPSIGILVDPRILYDHGSDAWVACAVDVQHQYIVLATKNAIDPTPLNGWPRHTIPVAYENSLPDFPTLGVDKNGVYITALQRHTIQGTSEVVNDAQTILAFKKPAIYAGNLNYNQFTIDTDPAALKVWTIQPAVTFDDPPAGQELTYAVHSRVFDDWPEPANPFWYYFPSLMVNATGDMAMGFSGASAESYIGAFYSLRLANGATIYAPVLIQAGQFYHYQPRLGDYSATTLDPVDGLSFWTVQEFAKDETVPPLDAWGTIIAKLQPSP